MKLFLNYTTAQIFALFLISHMVNGQKYINPVKNLSVSLLYDTLLFKELVSNKVLFKLAVEKGSTSHYLKFSPYGDFMITSGTGPVTNLYIIQKDTATLIASVPILTEEGVFSESERELFLLHSRSLFSTRLSSYSTKSLEKLADTSLSFPAHGLTIDASATLLGFCENTNIRTFHAQDLKADRAYRQRTAQRLLTFNPAVPDQVASISKENLIQIRDTKKDTVLLEIKAHSSKIVWLGYDPTGNLLVSLDKQGYLFTWMPLLKKCIAQIKGVGGIPVFNPDGTLNLSSNDKGEEPGFVKHKKTVAFSNK